MLDVHRRPDVDAGADQLLDVLVALRVAAFGRVGVRQFIDDDDAGPARERGVDVEFFEIVALIGDDAARQNLEPVEQRRRFGASVRLDDADDDVGAVGLEAAGARQHGVGLADAGRGAEKDGELAPRVLVGQRQKRVWIRPLLFTLAFEARHSRPA